MSQRSHLNVLFQDTETPPGAQGRAGAEGTGRRRLGTPSARPHRGRLCDAAPRWRVRAAESPPRRRRALSHSVAAHAHSSTLLREKNTSSVPCVLVTRKALRDASLREGPCKRNAMRTSEPRKQSPEAARGNFACDSNCVSQYPFRVHLRHPETAEWFFFWSFPPVSAWTF